MELAGNTKHTVLPTVTAAASAPAGVVKVVFLNAAQVRTQQTEKPKKQNTNTHKWSQREWGCTK